MSTIVEQDFPYDILHRGKADEHRHNKRVDDAVRKQLKDIISSQDIITSEGNKKVKIKLKYLDQYRFMHNRDRIDEIGRDEFDDLSDEEIIYKPEIGDGAGKSQPGDDPGEELYEAEYTIDELTDLMFDELELPDLDETKKNEIISEVFEWTDRQKKFGIQSALDKKHTLLANILRRARLKQTKPIPIINDDLRFRTWQTEQERHSNAVVFLLMDRSGSMSEQIYAVKALYFWIVQFLKRRYDRVELRFIAHDTTARELNESEFFSISDSGGTAISSAYKLSRDMIQNHYPASEWNIYCFHASDGDSYNDEAECISIVREMITKLGISMFAYTEMDTGGMDLGRSKIYGHLKRLSNKHPEVIVSVIHATSDILDVLKEFLKHSVQAA